MIERIKEAFEEHGWAATHLRTEDGYDLARDGLSVWIYADEMERWLVEIGDDYRAAITSCPLHSLRLAYARCDSVRVRAMLRPVLVALRESPRQRQILLGPCFEQINTICSEHRLEEWFGPFERRWDKAWWDTEEMDLDTADRALLALDLAGPAPEAIRDAIAELRARLEEMG